MKKSDKSPLVMCITNSVAVNFTANVLLALGAKPAMVENPSEAAELAALADATLINVGTVDERQAEAMFAAARSCNRNHKPWVLDPVAVQVLEYRRALAKELLNFNPAIIRGNHAEISFLKGVVSSKTAVLATGAEDSVICRGKTVKIDGGVPMLQLVTATGCAQGAVCAAFLGWGQTPRNACISASKLMKMAGEAAYERAKTPGAFQYSLLDSIYELSNAND